MAGVAAAVGTARHPARAAGQRWKFGLQRRVPFFSKPTKPVRRTGFVSRCSVRGSCACRFVCTTGCARGSASRLGNLGLTYYYMPSTSSITPTSSAATTGATSTDTISGPQQTLTQNNFLQLLVAQMENQDPLEPQSDTEMASQMAQFTALQQTSDMSSSLSMMQANSLVGSTVTLQLDSQNTTSGVVQSVELGAASSDGTPQIVVNGTAYDLSQVLSITPPVTTQTSTTSPSSTATN